MQSSIFLVILMSLLLGMSLYFTIFSWRTHKQRQRATADRGWRYTNSLIHSLFRSTYIIAGTTPNGIVWELQRSQKKGKLFFNWTTSAAPLPYGLIRILPRRASVSHQSHPLLRLTSWQHEQWQQPALAEYVVLTSHQRLGERFLTPEVALALSHWPEWPLPGALESVNWSRERLEVEVRYVGDWATADRLVALGAALVSPLTPPTSRAS